MFEVFELHYFVSGLALCPTVPELLLTASEDKTVKIWNVKENQPKLVVTKDMGLVRFFFVFYYHLLRKPIWCPTIVFKPPEPALTCVILSSGNIKGAGRRTVVINLWKGFLVWSREIMSTTISISRIPSLLNQ